MRRALVLAGGLLSAAAAMAQPLTMEPSAAVQCLTPAADHRGGPEYPFVAYKQGLSGRVKVQLRFTGPALAPAVTVLEQSGDHSFVDAVRAHVGSLRVPCMAGDQAVDLAFDFVFQPDAPRVVAWPEDMADAQRQQQLDCIHHTGDANMPDYPENAVRQGVQGRVLVELRFEAPDQPPVARILPRVGGDAAEQRIHGTSVFVDPLRDWVAGYRLPCLQGPPITLSQVYVYKIADSQFGFKPGLGLRNVLPLVKGLRQQRLLFDFSTMGCPFDVSLTYRQPNMPNSVRALGDLHPARDVFLEWLRQMQLDLPDKTLDAVYGDTLQFAVPCLKIDIKPQE